MDRTSRDKPDGLEDRLRNMILNNVTIGSNQTNHKAEPFHQGRGRGRGRFRGTYFLNSNSHHHNIEQRQGGHENTHASSRRGTGRAHPFVSHHTNPRDHEHSVTGTFPNHSGHEFQPPQEVRNGQSVSSGHGEARGYSSSMFHRQYRGLRASSYGCPTSPRFSPQQASYALHSPINNVPENSRLQVAHLDNLVVQQTPKVELSQADLEAKEAFKRFLQAIVQQTFLASQLAEQANVSLVEFGSVASGFGLPGSDMDLAIIAEWKDSSRVARCAVGLDFPRFLEKAVLDAKLGGRLLTKTRIPILKVCQSPTDALYSALRKEREKWDQLSEEEKLSGVTQQPEAPSIVSKAKIGDKSPDTKSVNFDADFPALGRQSILKIVKTNDEPSTQMFTANMQLDGTNDIDTNTLASKESRARTEKQWLREKTVGPLDFPKSGVGIQCDINFENELAIHNTHLLRCYSATDQRVRPVILFVKSWAKTRKINSSYSGTLSSYGWVLMVLHYLVNVAQPPVCPNLQYMPEASEQVDEAEIFQQDINGYRVRFWSNVESIFKAAKSGQLSQNTQSVGAILRGFFQYFASLPAGYYGGRRPRTFIWTTEVLSLRTRGGLQTKQTKGWIGATTNVTTEKKVKNRYLLAIEDPFELGHNVARTVNHPGICAIRDEFRRAWMILRDIGQGLEPEGGLFHEVVVGSLRSHSKHASGEQERQENIMPNSSIKDVI